MATSPTPATAAAANATATGGSAVRGRHHQLLARGGAYAQMWALQQQEEAAEPDTGALPDPA